MLHPLGTTPVLGVDMSRVRILRLDQTGGSAPGNKSFKLRLPLENTREAGLGRIVSFGGPWSNHLHALAATGAEDGLETIGLVRGDADYDTAMLRDARRLGMQLVHLSRSDYRRRNDEDFLAQVKQQYAPCLVLPEGGAAVEGARGCAAIAQMIRETVPAPARVVLAVGTGTTLAGIAAGLGQEYRITGISALKGAVDLGQRVASLLEQLGADAAAPWEILHQFHCGGFARVSDELKAFILAFEQVHGIALDPVYTSKMLYAVHAMLGQGSWASNELDELDEPIVAVHTGGLQGRRGYPWLFGQPGT